MKALLIHCKTYHSEVTGFANTPNGIEPEPGDNNLTEAKDAIATLITVEQGDDIERINSLLATEVRKMCADTGHSNVIIMPFAHLSNKLADSPTSKRCLDLIESNLKDLHLHRVHFGSDKALMLDIYGHRGNVRYREF